MNYKAIIFDLDGTLLDSMKVWDDVDERFIANHNITVPKNFKEIMKTLSFEQSAQYFIDEFHLDMTVKQVTDEFKITAEHEYENIIPLKPYVREFLEANKNLKMCVATATDTKLAEAALKRLGVLKYFDFILTCTEVGKSKESPEIFIEAAKRMKTDVYEAVVVEDSVHAALTAKKAGFNVLGIYDEYSDNDKEKMQKICDKFILSYKDML